MPDLNDVVRHVILRLIVDQAGFGEDLAKARSRLKELEKAEHDSNTARVKDSERVQKAYEGRKKAIDEERKAAESAAKVARQDYKTVSGEDRADRGATARQLREDINAAAARRRADETAAAGRERADSNAANKRRTESLKVNAAIERSDEESGQRIYNRQSEAEEKLTTLKSTNQKKLTTQALLDAEKVAKARLGTKETTERNEAASLRRQRTAEKEEQREAAAGTRRVQRVFDAVKRSVEASKQLASQKDAEEAKEEKVSTRRGARQLSEITRSAQAAKSLASQREQAAKEEERRLLNHERVLERARAAAARDAARDAARRNPIGALIGDVLTVAARSVTSAPAAAIVNRRTSSTRGGDGGTRGLAAEVRGVENDTKRAETAAGRLFSAFRRGAGDAEKSIGGLGSRVKAFFEDINRPRVGGSGGNLGGDIIKNFTRAGDAISKNFSGLGQSLLSFQGLIVAAIAGLGPLAAIIGAIGAAALGLASNLGALVGVFAALPGLIGAAVGGFGALALVMQPLSNIFSTFSAAQKEAATTTKRHTAAVLDYKDAVLSEQAAELAYQRAQQDLPRSYTKLSEARRQAARSIQDYRLQLQKLKFDEEGAQLDVESAQRAYRRSLADPTSTALDRRIARHNVEGAQFDKRDQAVAGQRLLEDSTLAFRKGVEGADAVVEAERAVQDATLNVAQSYIAWQKSILAVNKAAMVKAAGGTAAAQLQAELAKLPPETRKVAKAILDLMNGPYKQFRDRLSENIFGPISTETGKFAGVLKDLESFMGPASTAMGIFAKHALDLLTNPDWKKFFSDQGKESGYIIGQLGDALLGAAEGFRGIVEAARPFTRFVVDGIKSLAESFGAFTTSSKGQKQISDFLELTKKRMQELWPVIKNFAAGIAGFFAALNTAGGGQDDFTTWLNKGLLSASETFKKLGEAARDPNSGFQKWLRDVRPLLHDVVGFLSSAGTFFVKMFSDPHNMAEASTILKEISQKWLPRLADIFSRLSESGIISKLTTAISHIFGGIQDFLASGGGDWLKQLGNAFIAIGAAVEKVSGPIGHVFGIIADTIKWLIDNVPGLGGILTALGTVAAFAIGGVLLSKFSGLTAAVKILIGTYKTLRDVIKSIKWDKIPLINKIPGVKGGRSGTTGSSLPGGGLPGGGGTATAAGITGHLTRIEVYLRQIAINTGAAPLSSDLDVDEKEGKGGKHRPGKHGRGRGKRALLNEAEDIGEDVAEGAAKKPGFLSKISRFFGRVGPPAGDAGSVAADMFAPSGRRAATTAAESAAERAALSAGERGLAARAGGAALRGLKGGVAGVALSVGAELLGGAAIDKFVKNKDDNSSLHRGLGAVANGAGIGATIGSIIPGVGTVVGGVVGGAIGGAYSLARDKNLRNFVGGKIAGAGHAVADMFTGGDAKPGLGGAAATVMGPLGAAISKTDIGKSIFDSLNKAGGKIGNFFTHTIPAFFARGVNGITNFFTKTLPSLPGRAFDAFFHGVGRMLRFFTKDLPHAASSAWHGVVHNLWDPFMGFVKGIPGFFTKTIPQWFHSATHWFSEHVEQPVHNFVSKTLPRFFSETIPRWFRSATHWFSEHVEKPVHNFVSKTLPHFFSDTVPKWFAQVPHWFKTHVIDNISHFFGTTVPNFFTVTIPGAIKKLPGFLYDSIVKPVVDFFTGIWSHIKSGAASAWNWAKGLFHRAGSDIQEGYDKKMSGGLISGVYQGIEDRAKVLATPGEFMVRRSMVQQPGGKQFLDDFNEGRIDPALFYGALTNATSPSARAVPVAAGVAGVGPTIVNHTVNHAPLMGDVTINNPVRERSEHSLRRQVQIAAIRHRR